jgi:DNA-binding protein Fis
MSEESSRNIAKRQIARLVAGAVHPCYVLSETGHIVFANEAFGRLLRTDPDELIGINCSPIAPVDSTRPSWASWFASPPNRDAHQVSIHSDIMPNALVDWISERTIGMDSKQGVSSSLLNETRWVQISIPLDDLESPTVLYLLKEDRGDFAGILDSVRASKLRSIVIQGKVEHPELQMHWFLAGTSVDAQRVRSQIRLAANGNHPCRLTGTDGSPLIQCAVWIARERLLRLSSKGAGKPEVITIECRLMDRELLTDILEMADETMRRNPRVYVLLNQLERLSADLREPLAKKLLAERWMVIATTTPEASLAPSDLTGDWGTLVASLDTQTIGFTPIRLRVPDIEPLVVSWFETHHRAREISTQARWTKDFMDALLAYSWPNDCNELGDTLEHAWRQATIENDSDRRVHHERTVELTDKHLPISLRTFPSHMNRPPIEHPIELDRVLEQLERDLILRALERKKSNRTAAAQLLGISRARLLRKLQQWGLGASESTSEIEDDSPIFEEVDEANE